jgi:antitoxin component YwqK of YwqJK toxin-antitoxin module
MMKYTTIILSILTVLLFACSKKDNRVIVLDTFGNGQPKTTIYKTIDSKNTYYEIIYDSLGRITEITPYSNRQMNGTKIYFQEDNLGVSALESYKNSKREGFAYEFYDRQQIGFKGESKDGEFNGQSTWFDKGGRPKSTGVRTNGKKEGEWLEYYENGQIKAKGTYLNGSKQNDWIYWNSDGTIDTNSNH